VPQFATSSNTRTQAASHSRRLLLLVFVPLASGRRRSVCLSLPFAPPPRSTPSNLPSPPSRHPDRRRASWSSHREAVARGAVEGSLFAFRTVGILRVTCVPFEFAGPALWPCRSRLLALSFEGRASPAQAFSSLPPLPPPNVAVAFRTAGLWPAPLPLSSTGNPACATVRNKLNARTQAASRSRRLLPLVIVPPASGRLFCLSRCTSPSHPPTRHLPITSSRPKPRVLVFPPRSDGARRSGGISLRTPYG
jgi:hypothetical protein